MTISSRPLLGFALATVVAGCGLHVSTDPAEAQVAADGTQAMVASSQSTNLAGVIWESVSASDPAQAAAQLGAPTHVWPAACVSSEKDPGIPDRVHVTFDDCTGPFGLVHVDGEAVVTFSAGPGGALHVIITGQSITANDKPVSFDAIADVTYPSPTTRNVVWQGSWTRVDEHRETVAHTSDLEIAVDLTTDCSTANGSAHTTVGPREVDTAVTDYKLCRDTTGTAGCPSGQVTHSGKVSGKTVSVRFDGSDVAEVTSPRGNSFPVDLVCTSIGR